MGQVIPYKDFLQLRAARLALPAAYRCFVHCSGTFSVIISMKSRDATPVVADRVARVQETGLGHGILYEPALVSRP
jgi:hypothetical protein